VGAVRIATGRAGGSLALGKPADGYESPSLRGGCEPNLLPIACAWFHKLRATRAR